MNRVHCDICNISFRSDYKSKHLKTKKHIKLANGNKQNIEQVNGEYSCQHCEYTTTRKYNLERHIKSKHTNNNKIKRKYLYKCTFCGTYLTDKSNVNAHIKRDKHQDKCEEEYAKELEQIYEDTKSIEQKNDRLKKQKALRKKVIMKPIIKNTKIIEKTKGQHILTKTEILGKLGGIKNKVKILEEAKLKQLGKINVIYYYSRHPRNENGEDLTVEEIDDLLEKYAQETQKYRQMLKKLKNK